MLSVIALLRDRSPRGLLWPHARPPAPGGPHTPSPRVLTYGAGSGAPSARGPTPEASAAASCGASGPLAPSTGAPLHNVRRERAARIGPPSRARAKYIPMSACNALNSPLGCARLIASSHVYFMRRNVPCASVKLPVARRHKCQTRFVSQPKIAKRPTPRPSQRRLSALCETREPSSACGKRQDQYKITLLLTPPSPHPYTRGRSTACPAGPCRCSRTSAA